MEITPYEDFRNKAYEDLDAHRDRMEDSGVFDFVRLSKSLIKFQNNVSYYTLVRMFGEQPGAHLWENFTQRYSRNSLNFLGNLEAETQFYILHQIKTNNIIY